MPIGVARRMAQLGGLERTYRSWQRPAMDSDQPTLRGEQGDIPPHSYRRDAELGDQFIDPDDAVAVQVRQQKGLPLGWQ